MNEKLLSILLIGFSVLFLFIILGWSSFKKIFRLDNPDYGKARFQYNRLRGIHVSYRLILIAFAIISLIYFLYPKSQEWFGPIQWLNNDYVNITGLVVLVLAFVLVISNQLKLDKNLHRYYFDPSQQSDSSLVPKTESNLLKSILLVYVGLFVVVSTIATAVLLLIALIVYYLRSSNRKYRIRTPISSKQQPYL
jgi:hypothetical protein